LMHETRQDGWLMHDTRHDLPHLLHLHMPMLMHLLLEARCKTRDQILGARLIA